MPKKRGARRKQQHGGAGKGSSGPGSLGGAKKFVDSGPKTKSQFNIRVEDFDISFGRTKLLQGATLKLAFGRRYGLIGPNGAGKTTLLSHISQRLLPGIPEDISILHVEQEVEGSEISALEAVISADTERLELLEERDKLELEKEGEDEAGDAAQERLVQVYRRLSEIGAYNAEARAAVILSGLQFDEEMQRKCTKEFSGGWRMRIALARALFCRPHLLLLDEPTNHLDLFAAVWLEDFLSKWRKTLVIVSHDEEILENVCTDIIHLYCKGLDYYRGNYSSYERAFEERRRAHKKAWDKQVKEDKAMKKAKGDISQPGNGKKKKKGARGGRPATKEKRTGGRESKSAAAQKALKAKQRQAEKKDRVREPPKDYTVSFEFPDPGKLPHPVINVKNVSFHYYPEGKEETPPTEKNNKWIFQGIDFGFYQKDRVALVGRNGVGKSTLIKLLTGELDPVKGEIYITPKLNVGRFHQHSPDQLEMTKSPVEYLRDKHGCEIGEARRLLGRFGLSGQTHTNKIETLSGGQKARVCLTDLSLMRPHILFLDEPTNHLDIQSIKALSSALQEFQGGVVMVSHDKRLISTACNKLWIVENKKVRVYDDDFESYEEEMAAQMTFAEEDDYF